MGLKEEIWLSLLILKRLFVIITITSFFLMFRYHFIDDLKMKIVRQCNDKWKGTYGIEEIHIKNRILIPSTENANFQIIFLIFLKYIE